VKLETTIEKLDQYYARLSGGKAEQIKSTHVEKVIRKLKAKEEILQTELAETSKQSKKDRIKRKITTINEQIERAEWLLKTIGES